MPVNKSKPKRSLVQIDGEIVDRLRELSKASMIPMARLVRSACELYIEKMEQPMKELMASKRRAGLESK